MLYLDFLATGESPIGLIDAAKLLPTKPNGKHLSYRAMETYVRYGYGPAGAKVFLEGAKVGGAMVTSREALQRFIQKCSIADELRHSAPDAPSRSIREEAADV